MKCQVQLSDRVRHLEGLNGRAGGADEEGDLILSIVVVESKSWGL